MSQFVKLAVFSLHTCQPWREHGYAWTTPLPRQYDGDGFWADTHVVTHIEMRPDVVVRSNDESGADVYYDPEQPCPFCRVRTGMEAR